MGPPRLRLRLRLPLQQWPLVLVVLLLLVLLHAVTVSVDAFLLPPGSSGFALRRPLPRVVRLLRRVATAGHDGGGGGQGEGAVVLGINKYSHDVSCTVVSAATGDVLFMAEKERVSRKKHDAGDAADLVEWSLAAVGRELSDVALVVQQNHHWRIAPFERRLPWACALEHYPVSYLEESSLLPGLAPARRLELSHHLAHAWSVFPQAPFEKGLVVVMDGMGEQHKAMARALRDQDPGFVHDLTLPKHEAFVQVPAALDPLYDYREAETAYYFDGASLQLVFKRYTRERSPPELYNHGFENMESMGAIYSRISSHIFGDWNACGKVMGLASYARPEEVAAMPRFMGGALAAGRFAVDWDALAALAQPNKWREADAATTAHYARLAGRVQMDLEETALPWIRDLKARTGAENLCVCGGVAQNSVLNGRIARELGFNRVFIPPYPGDEGVSVGCALWGFAALSGDSSNTRSKGEQQQQQQPPPPPPLPAHPPLRRRYEPLPPYQGRSYTDEEVQAEALEPYGPFIVVERLPSMESVVEATVDALTQGEVVAWFQGRSECGPRALGDRSLLADPRVAAVHPFLNRVKGREAFRPFAPSVLAEAARDWFEGAAGPDGPTGPDGGVESPYMSLTLPVRPECRHEVPAICHVDGSARLQTVRDQDNPWYHRLIQAFARRTGVPMVLNTSFNIRGEPIVETPAGAVRSFLSTNGGVGLLALGQFLVRRRPFPTGEARGLDPALCVARRADGILLEEVVRDSGTGVARSVRVALGSEDGRPVWVDLASELDLFVLSSVDGVTPLEDLVEEVVESLEDGAGVDEGEEPVTPEEVTAALRRLYEKQLIFFV